jgi:glycine betaine/proline transport system ATP-binding protein
MSDMIAVDRLTKVFGSAPERALALVEEGVASEEIRQRLGASVAVRQVSFRVREGEIFVVMGLSGSGKSTLVRLLDGLIAASAGEVSIAGRSVTRMGPRQLVEFRRSTTAMVFQSFALFPHRSALENAAFGLEVAGLGRGERLRRAQAALEQVGLGGDAQRLPAELSGGMRQRVGLARALAKDPPVLLMDEAFSALDPLIRREMQEQLLHLQRRQRRTIVFISHDLDEAIRLGDRIALMEQGRLLQVGTPQELLLQPAEEGVRRFFRDVDPASVLTVKDLVEQPPVVLDPQGPLDRTTLELCRGGSAAAVAYLVDRTHRYCGLLPRESLLDLDRGEPPAAGGGAASGPVLAAATPVQEAIGVVARASHPVPVLGERDRFLGVVSPRGLLRFLGS